MHFSLEHRVVLPFYHLIVGDILCLRLLKYEWENARTFPLLLHHCSGIKQGPIHITWAHSRTHSNPCATVLGLKHSVFALAQCLKSRKCSSRKLQGHDSFQCHLALSQQRGRTPRQWVALWQHLVCSWIPMKSAALYKPCRLGAMRSECSSAHKPLKNTIICYFSPFPSTKAFPFLPYLKLTRIEKTTL